MLFFTLRKKQKNWNNEFSFLFFWNSFLYFKKSLPWFRFYYFQWKMIWRNKIWTGTTDIYWMNGRWWTKKKIEFNNFLLKYDKLTWWLMLIDLMEYLNIFVHSWPILINTDLYFIYYKKIKSYTGRLARCFIINMLCEVWKWGKIIICLNICVLLSCFCRQYIYFSRCKNGIN